MNHIKYGALLLLLSSQTVNAAGWTLFAGKEDGYVAEPAVSIIAGQMSPGDKNLDPQTITGLELSLNCPLLQPPTNRIRQQISYTTFKQDEFTLTNIELNPHYVVEVSPKLEIGGGPGFGYLMTSGGAKNPSLLAVNVGASAHYFGLGPVFLGAEWRYQLTTSEDFGGTDKQDMNNWRFAAKVGYSF
ncbi:MAG: hypothetical protein OEX00_06920 [Gammaproteobacteria bacterium]|nr:hypothetical protein [Gammaproteobacteria bacterium]MDH5694720.1 hypothetical protein [Gammaproteobacteria bacterium]